MLFVFLTSFLIASCSLATIINVPDDFTTIQEAIDESVDGDTVLASSGIYVEHIDYDGKDITIASHFLTTGDDSYIQNTIIDGDSSGTVVTFARLETEDAALIGFTIRNGYSQLNGGGIECFDSNPVISNCIITDNHTGTWGGGVRFERYADGVITNCEIHNNSSTGDGGGIECINSDPVISGCYIHHNTAERDGGGLTIHNGSDPLVENCVFYENTAINEGGAILIYFGSSPAIKRTQILDNISSVSGGGIAVYNSAPVITGCLFEDNETEGDGGEIAITYGSTCDLINCTFDWESEDYTAIFIATSYTRIINSSLYGQMPLLIEISDAPYPSWIMVAHSNVPGGAESIQTSDNATIYWEDGNIDADPMYVDLDDGDYNLRPNSPCVDAGTAFFVWQDDTLLNLSEDEYNGNAPDIGAYESEYQAGISRSTSQPTEFTLIQNYPNPFNSSTTITYSLPEASNISLKLYDLSGRTLGVLSQDHKQAGTYSTSFNSEKMASGYYILRLLASGKEVSRKITLIK
ncbi:right-handed parallel beta-helix repeat-containing protein [Calditrichota bacterium]